MRREERVRKMKEIPLIVWESVSKKGEDSLEDMETCEERFFRIPKIGTNVDFERHFCSSHFLFRYSSFLSLSLPLIFRN